MKFRVVGVIVLALTGVGIYLYVDSRQEELPIDNFESCVKAGYPVAESYPEVCRGPNGQNFTNSAQKLRSN